MAADFTIMWWWFGAIFGVAWFFDVPVARRQWREAAKRFQAPPPSAAPMREFMYVRVRFRFTDLSMVREWECFVALEPAGIRFQRGRLVGAGYDILVPWALIGSCAAGRVSQQRGYYEGTFIRLVDGGEVSVEDPAGKAAWFQWRRMRPHGPGTPIVGA